MMAIVVPYTLLVNIPQDNYHVNYTVTSIGNPNGHFCEYRLYGVYEISIVDSIGKYHVGQVIKIP